MKFEGKTLKELKKREKKTNNNNYLIICKGKALLLSFNSGPNL